MAKQFGERIKFETPGTLYPLLSEREVQWALNFEQESIELAKESGEKPAAYMDREAALIAEPALGPDVLGALVCPGDGHINPKKYVRALAEEV